MKQVGLWLPEEMLAAVDRARGAVPRQRWIRDVILAELLGSPRPDPARWAASVPTAELEAFLAAGGSWPVRVPVDDPPPNFVPTDPEARARSRAIWEETVRRVAGETQSVVQPAGWEAAERQAVEEGRVLAARVMEGDPAVPVKGPRTKVAAAAEAAHAYDPQPGSFRCKVCGKNPAAHP